MFLAMQPRKIDVVGVYHGTGAFNAETAVREWLRAQSSTADTQLEFKARRHANDFFPTHRRS
jgi:hypothetical protein